VPNLLAMIRFINFGLLALYGLFLAISIFRLATRHKPHGDAVMDWAFGVFFMIGLTLDVAIAILLWRRPALALVTLLLPLLVAALPLIKTTSSRMYAKLPSRTAGPALLLTIRNTTKAKLRLNLECWFGSALRSGESLYTSFEFFVEPLETSIHQLNQYQTNLLAKKSKYVGIRMFERVACHFQDATYLKDIQPCMQYQEENIAAFRSGEYTIVIDGSHNTEMFTTAVAREKEQNGYGSGVF
jgi:hypothetical protein